MRAQIFGLVALTGFLACGVAGATGITVSNGWIRALPANVPSGGYFTLINDSGKSIILTGASSPACEMLMLHKTESSSGMASMSDVVNIPIPAGGRISFAPGGYHLMCMHPGPQIRPGNKVPVTLVFADGSKFASQFVVRNAAGQ